jgi:polyisoprenoid-binding protein YceI
MKYIITLLLPAVLYSFVADKLLKFDATHSNLVFSIGHLGVSEIRGSVNLKESSVTMKGSDFANADIALTVDMTTVDTDNEKRNAHLQTADFFDTAKYPDAKFMSTSCVKTGENTYTLSGDFTMHGVTKPITANMTTKTGNNPNNNKPITGIKVTTTIKRLDFGIASSAPKEVLSDEVEVIANLEYSYE